MDTLKEKIRHVPDFPKAGILFYDVTTLLRDPQGLRQAIDSLSLPYEGRGIDLVVGIESRGFILGAAVADRIGAGFVLVRKVGKLPSATIQASYSLEYGTDNTRDAHGCDRARTAGADVDDTARHRRHRGGGDQLVKQLGGKVDGLAFLIELLELKGRDKLPASRSPPSCSIERRGRYKHRR